VGDTIVICCLLTTSGEVVGVKLRSEGRELGIDEMLEIEISVV